MMSSANPNRLMIAGTGSGCGKTTLTCAVLGGLKAKGLQVTSFKSGPDYIDPMFHTKVLGTRSRNLDLFLMSENGVLYSLGENTCGADLAVIEGVMGFYDGMGKTADFSSWDLSEKTKTPVVLTVGCKGISLTICSLISGLKNFRKNRIAGVLLNQVSSEKMFEMYRDMIEQHTGLKVYGYLPKMPDVSLESRHLGLVTADEVGRLKEIIAVLAEQAKKTIDLEGLAELSKQAEAFEYQDIPVVQNDPVRIAVAKDQAFCFYYEDNLTLLQRLGAELVPFSPLEDAHLPKQIDGVIFGGGYPELYLEKLGANTTLIGEIRNVFQKGMPMIGECGGFMYLQEAVRNQEKEYPLVGCIPSKAEMTKRLQRFGYICLTAEKDNLLCHAGDTISAHEFHYADSTCNGMDFTAEKVSTGRKYPCIIANEHLFAGYPHLHYYGNPTFAQNFIEACSEYRRKNR